MYEDERHFSWTNLFIKIIIVVIFILFTIWLLSLSVKSGTRGLSNSLDVLTDKIFSENVDKMKEVGKSYFTTERLPEKVGEVKTLTLAKMYDEDLILELKDKNGNACSAKNSYVVVEKMENEYQMKVYLECGLEKDSIKVIMGCYDYCNKDICEKKQEVTPTIPSNVNLEYEYSKVVGGNWTSYGSWSEWSRVSIDKTNYRDVETKTVREEYEYDKEVVETKYVGDATCPSINGYELTKNENGVCTYSKTVTSVEDPLTCDKKTSDGYKLVSQDGFTCNYSKDTSTYENPVTCPSKNGDYILTSQDGFTCNYSKTTTTNPVACPIDGDYKLTSQNGFTCNYAKEDADVLMLYIPMPGGNGGSGSSGSGTGSGTINVPGGVNTGPSCSGCGDVVTPTYRGLSYSGLVYGNIAFYSCPSDYTQSGMYCVKTTVSTKTITVGCPSGYTKSGNTCVSNGTTNMSTTVGCPNGYTQSGNSCVSKGTTNMTTSASCPNGYAKNGKVCTKSVVKTTTEKATCGSNEKISGGKCYKDVKTTKRITEERDVTYYRYRLREYVNGTTDYKWSTSNNDKSLLDSGYKLTGRTRNIGGK